MARVEVAAAVPEVPVMEQAEKAEQLLSVPSVACTVQLEVVRDRSVYVASCDAPAEYAAVCRGCGMDPLLCGEHFADVTTVQVVSCMRCLARGSLEMIFDTRPI